MTKRSCTAILILLFATFCFAQPHLGLRVGAGASALRSHIPLTVSGVKDVEAIRLNPAFSASAGIAFAYDFNSVISVAPELQYTLYRANGRFIKKNDEALADMNEAGVRLYTLELPVLLRISFGNFSIGKIYTEIGPQVGANLDATAYINSQMKSPDEKPLAFGPTLGFGLKTNTFLFGVRGHFGIFEYAKDTKGYPWTAQAGITKFFF